MSSWATRTRRAVPIGGGFARAADSGRAAPIGRASGIETFRWDGSPRFSPTIRVIMRPQAKCGPQTPATGTMPGENRLRLVRSRVSRSDYRVPFESPPRSDSAEAGCEAGWIVRLRLRCSHMSGGSSSASSEPRPQGGPVETESQPMNGVPSSVFPVRQDSTSPNAVPVSSAR